MRDWEKNDIRGGDGGQVRDAARSRETSANAGSRFRGPSQTPDTPHAVRDHGTAETHFVGISCAECTLESCPMLIG